MSCASIKGAAPIIYHLKSEISIMLRCQQSSTRYTAIQIKNYSKGTSVGRVATMKIQAISEASYHQIDTFHCQWNTKEGTVSPWRMYCMYCSMLKGTSRAKVTSNNEKIKLVALSLLWTTSVVHHNLWTRNQIISQSVRESEILETCFKVLWSL